jgi:hypothetical protein
MPLAVNAYDLGDQTEFVAYYQGNNQNNAKKKQGESALDNWIEESEQLTIETDFDKLAAEAEAKAADNISRSIRRSRTKVRRVCSRYKMKYMWTLTFAAPEVQVINPTNKRVSSFDAGDIQDAWDVWKLFLQRCRKAGLDFSYIATIELQEKRLENHGQRVYHFHFATDKLIPINRLQALKAGKKAWMQKFWTFGHVFVTRSRSRNKLANNYLMKYISKSFDESNLKGQQRYRISEGMRIPVDQIKHHDLTYDDVSHIVSGRGNVIGFKAITGEGRPDVHWYLVDNWEDNRP